MKNYFCTLLVAGVAFGLSFYATPAQASVTMYTYTGFIELLFEKGLIAETERSRANELLTILAEAEDSETVVSSSTETQLLVEASQYIEHGTLRFKNILDIEGLLLLVQNTGEKSRIISVNKNCPVRYLIENEEGEMLYDNYSEEKCSTKDLVQYGVSAGETKTFEVSHKRKLYPLQKGMYRFVMELEGYGSGVREIEVY